MPLFGPPNITQLEAKRDTQGLIKALTYKDATIRIAAADALAPLRDPIAVEPLVALLRDENAGVRRAAVAALSVRGGFRVVEPLVASLNDPDPDVRTSAGTAVYRRLMTDPDADARRTTAAALGKIRDQNGVEPLIKAVMDADEGVRLASIRALQAIGDAAAVMPLIIVAVHEQKRQKATGQSSLAVERAATQALEVLCTAEAMPGLQAALRHDDPDVREMAVRWMGRTGSGDATGDLARSLTDSDPIVRRMAARGLADLQWQPPADESGVQYWAALRQWRRCAESGALAIPTLVASWESVDALEKADIVAALVDLDWKPEEAGGLAAAYLAARGEWDKCVEMGEAAVPALDGAARAAPHWRDRLAATLALASLGEQRTAPFARPELVQSALAILDGEAGEEEKHTAFQGFAGESGMLEAAGEETLEWCECGYPLSRVAGDGKREPLGDLLGFEQNGSRAVAYFCPGCDTKRPA
jgi:HEAT repeat protein